MNDGLKWIWTGSWIQILSSPSSSSASDWYLGSDGCGCDVGGGAVLSGRHTAVLLLLVLLLALHAFVLRLPAWRTVGRRGEGRRRRRQVLQLVRRLLYLHHGVPQEVDGVWQRGQDELEAFLDEERNKWWSWVFFFFFFKFAIFKKKKAHTEDRIVIFITSNLLSVEKKSLLAVFIYIKTNSRLIAD